MYHFNRKQIVGGQRRPPGGGPHWQEQVCAGRGNKLRSFNLRRTGKMELTKQNVPQFDKKNPPLAFNQSPMEGISYSLISNSLNLFRVHIKE